MIRRLLFRTVAWCCASLFALTGCSVSSVLPHDMTPTNQTASRDNQTQSEDLPYKDLLEKRANQIITGIKVSDLPSDFTFTEQLRHYAFSNAANQVVYLYDTNDSITNMFVFDQNLKLIKKLSFPDFQLKRAILRDQILYMDDFGGKTLKVNIDSGDHSVIGASEMQEIQSQTIVSGLNKEETPVLQLGSYVYTNVGTIYDLKNQAYVKGFDQKGSAYPHAEFSRDDYLYGIDPRSDGSIEIHWYQASQGQVSAGNSIVFRLQLPDQPPVSQNEYTMTAQGDLDVFVIGANIGAAPVVQVFRIPLAA